MSNTPTKAEFFARLAREQAVSESAVSAVFQALRRGGGTMAQLSHADFGGMAQWSPGMTMVGDMFNEGLKTKLNSIIAELSAYLREHPDEAQHEDNTVSHRSAGETHGASWWPARFGDRSAVGEQNQMRYAAFPDRRRLVIDDHGKIEIYDTGDHRISGVSQNQSRDSILTFVSQHGVVRLSDFAHSDAT